MVEELLLVLEVWMMVPFYLLEMMMEMEMNNFVLGYNDNRIVVPLRAILMTVHVKYNKLVSPLLL